jgi:hypothetical protein
MLDSNTTTEASVWQSMAIIADRLAKNPRTRVSAELAQTRQHLTALMSERQSQVDALMSQLLRAPQDLAVRQLVDQGNERLADLQIAEAILTALAD